MADVQEIIRIANTDIDGTKRIADAIQDITGVGDAYANAVVANIDYDPETRIGALADDDLERIREVIESPEESGIPKFLRNRRKDRETGDDKHLIGADLMMKEEFDIRRMKEMESYKGRRHEMGLPVRGQQTQASFRSGEKVGVERERVQAAAEPEEGEGGEEGEE
ncbi:MAG: 30S ribosomal protein S13 [Candidatus Nanohaloarchaea archaeon]